jgi:hypothetical protein
MKRKINMSKNSILGKEDKREVFGLFGYTLVISISNAMVSS